MVLDVRAEIISNLGPVISGSVRDDHIQGQGLIFTSGELTIAGLITPARGDVVNLAYITPDGGTAARFPRGPFRVVQAFANPLRSETQVSIANELAFHKNQGGGSINSAVTAGVNGRDPSIIPTTNLRETAGMICGRLSIEVGDLGTWDLPRQQMAIQCDDYIETLSEILASAGRVGYMSAENKLEVIEYASLGNGGPTLTFENIVDVNPNAGGLDFSERPLGEGEAQELEDDDEDEDDDTLSHYKIWNKGYGIFNDTWTETLSENWSELSLLLKNGANVTYTTVEKTTTEELQKEPDNRTISRTQTVINPLVKINSQYIQDHLNGGTPSGSYTPADREVQSTVTDTYEYRESRGAWMGSRTSWTREEKEQFEQEIETARQNFTDFRLDVYLLPELPTYRLESVTSEREMSDIEALGRIGFKDYSELPSLPSGSGIESREVTSYIYNGGKIKEIRNTYIAHGLTQIGQQSLAAAAEVIDPAVNNYFEIFLNAFWGLILDSHSVQIYSDPSISQDEVVPSYMAHTRNADIVYRGTSQIQVGEPDTPSSSSNNTTSFDPAFLPDDVMNDDGTITTAEESGESAYDALVRYAEEQNLLLLGHRLGMQIVTSLGRLPIEPLAAFHVQNDGITAMYRTNGMSWAFDSDSCLVSTDALYWGLVGGSVNGPRWTPVAPGITALPTPPAVVNNGAQAPANSITLTSTVNVSNQAAVNTLINSLPNTQTQTFPTQLTPTNISKPFNVIKEVSLSVGPRITVKTVPGGINRDMGSVVIATKPKVSVIEKTEAQVIKAKVDVTGPTWSQFTVDLDLDVTYTDTAAPPPFP